MWMRVGAPHDFATIFENLNPLKTPISTLVSKAGPLFNYFDNILMCHKSQSKIRTRMEAGHIAFAGGWCPSEQGIR